MSPLVSNCICGLSLLGNKRSITHIHLQKLKYGFLLLIDILQLCKQQFYLGRGETLGREAGREIFIVA